MPLPVLYLLLGAGIVLLKIKKKRATKWLFLIAGIWLLVISTRFIPDLLIRSLENRYPSLPEVEKTSYTTPIYVMVLGGGHSDDRDLPPNDLLSGAALGRLAEGIRLHRLLPESRLVLSGYPGRSSLSQAEVLARTALSLGVLESDIKRLATTRNTGDEAKIFFSEFGNKNTLILVTDAAHMPRAVMLFKKAGLDPFPAPANHIFKKNSSGGPFSWLPAGGNIVKVEVAVHEYAGILWSRMGGK
jgi:uncharacterized SAM-binding protein YcdF (DUF218 family)